MLTCCTLVRGIVPLAVLLAAIGLLAAAGSTVAHSQRDVHSQDRQSPAGVSPAPASPAERRHTTEMLTGRVVWLAEALERLFGVTSDPAAAETAVALETADGQLLPIVLDTRGQALIVDPRLRDRVNEMQVRRWEKQPLVQVMRIFHRQGSERFEIDYWCDVCAISMPILKDCECCQGPTRLREEKVVLDPPPSGR